MEEEAGGLGQRDRAFCRPRDRAACSEWLKRYKVDGQRVLGPAASIVEIGEIILALTLPCARLTRPSRQIPQLGKNSPKGRFRAFYWDRTSEHGSANERVRFKAVLDLLQGEEPLAALAQLGTFGDPG